MSVACGEALHDTRGVTRHLGQPLRSKPKPSSRSSVGRA